MKSFTYMSQEALEAVCEHNDGAANSGDYFDNKYHLELSVSDFRNLIAVLGWFYHHGPDVIDPDVQEADDMVDWSGSFVSSIAETLDVEMI